MAPQRVLMLGSGFVTRPTLDVLTSANIDVTVACRTIDSAKKLSQGVDRASPISLDVTDTSALDAAIAKHDLVISLIPYTLHAAVIQSAIRNKKNVVTTSYISPAMLQYDQQAKEAGITILNEIGLDPGLDHLFALTAINKIHEAGGKIVSFLSYCGGLPAPEDSGNPLGYKFSWSSRGVLLALKNAAKFLQDGKVVSVSGPELMATAKPYRIYPGFAFLAYPNRDSTPYRERYGIPAAQTVIRGTLRYIGFPEFIQGLADLGFLSDEKQSFLDEAIPWSSATQKLVGATSTDEKELLRAAESKLTTQNSGEKNELMTGLKWLGLFSDSKVIPKGNPLDTLCATLEGKMQYEKGERDMVMLQHRFEIEYEDGRKETMNATLCEYGAPVGSGGYSAMAKLVGIPCGVAVKQILNGTISEKGIIAPLSPGIINSLLSELSERYGISCKEERVP